MIENNKMNFFGENMQLVKLKVYFLGKKGVKASIYPWSKKHSIEPKFSVVKSFRVDIFEYFAYI